MSFHLINLIVLFYLHSNVSYISGTGAITDPFIIKKTIVGKPIIGFLILFISSIIIIDR